MSKQSSETESQEIAKQRTFEVKEDQHDKDLTELEAQQFGHVGHAKLTASSSFFLLMHQTQGHGILIHAEHIRGLWPKDGCSKALFWISWN